MLRTLFASKHAPSTVKSEVATVRRARAGDLLAIAALDREGYGADSRTWGTWKNFLQCPWWLVVVAERNGEVVGFGAYEAEGAMTDLVTLMVTESHRRLGVGGQILRALITLGRMRGEVGRVQVTLSERNLAAQRFLRPYGFRYVKTRPGWYRPDDGWVLERIGTPAVIPPAPPYDHTGYAYP